MEYASGDYIARSQGIGSRISMTTTGNPDETATKAETFFKTLKRDEVCLQEYRTFEEAEANVGRSIADVYHTKRLRSILGYLQPVEFVAAHPLSAPEGGPT